MKPADRISRIAPFHVMAILAKARVMQAAGRDIIHMEIGEPDFTTPQPVVDAGIAALNAGKTHYTPATGLPGCRNYARPSRLFISSVMGCVWMRRVLF